ncbi:carboxypeptidase-like regulatory domain-containing protein [Telmatobacter sp. DSM 110680]|uniref:Carboxypeptidase-like regulatory domain-containing protein n=1 Tax=Telmatobacter sp. DSM 110680 TaxID=3036704 RepID=A0AAU7DE12_9BACT
MRSKRTFLHAATTCLLFAGALAQAAQLTGTVTNKTTGKPAAGDVVVLVEPMTGMTEVAHTTVDASGHYTINRPSNAPALVKVTHQGAEFFADAPQSGTIPDVAVYDVAQKVDGVFVEADVLELEVANGQLHVIERYFVHNTSMPPRTQWSPKSFEIVLPEEAVVESAQGQRPSTGSLPTTLKLQPNGAKGHYAFNFPIQPDEGDKDTQFNISYALPYNGSFTFRPQESLATQSVGVLLPKSMTFTPGSGSAFTAINQDPNIQTFVAKNATPGKPLEFQVSGTGSMPREDQGAAGPGGPAAAAPGNGQPGGGIGEPINTPDPLSKYKWWILGGLALVFAAAAAFLLRKPEGTIGAVAQVPGAGVVTSAPHSYPATAISAASKNGALLSVLKEELFSLESEKLTGAVTPAEYAETKAALETVLKRALKNKS